MINSVSSGKGKHLFCIIVLLLLCFPARNVRADILSVGDLIKGASSSAVYYLGSDGKRYVFPNVAAYKSWYSDFSSVKIISETELKNISFGGVRLYKPGVRLLKVPTSPEVYEVTDYGVLQWLRDADVAVARHGDGWAGLVDDLPEIFFSDYKIGEPLTSAEGAAESPAHEQTGLGSLTVSLASESVSTSYVKKSTGVTVAVFRFGAGSGSDIKISGLTLTGYVDEAQGNPDFGQGGDSDYITTTYLRDLVSNFYLYDESGNQIAGPATSDFLGKIYFKNFVWTIPADATRKIFVKADLNPDAPYLNPDRFSVDIDRARTDIAAADQGGVSVVADGDQPNGALSPITIITIEHSGYLTAETDTAAPSSSIIPLGETGVLFNQLKFTATGEDFLIKKITFANVSSDYDRDVQKIWISYPRQDGSTETRTGNLQLGQVVFRDTNFYIPVGKVILQIFADIKTLPAGGKSGDMPGFGIDDKGEFEAYGQTSEKVFLETDFNTGYLSDKTRTPERMMLRKTKISVHLNPDTPIGNAERGFTKMMEFDLTADQAGQAKIKELTFEIRSSDTGTDGTDNDLIEKLADIDVEYGASVGHGDLYFAENPTFPLCEGYAGDISYSIYDTSTRAVITSPRGFETDIGDYGLLKFTCHYGSEIIVPAGSTKTVIFSLNTTGLISGINYGTQRVFVNLLGDREQADFSNDNFEWNDGEVDATGYTVNDLPLAGRVLYFP